MSRIDNEPFLFPDFYDVKGLTPHESIVKKWQIQPQKFTINLKHHTY